VRKKWRMALTAMALLLGLSTAQGVPIGEPDDGTAPPPVTEPMLHAKSLQLTIDLTAVEASLLQPLPPEEQVEEYRDLGLIAAGRFMFNADEETLARWVGIHGVARRGFNADIALSVYGAGRILMLTPNEALIVTLQPPAINFGGSALVR
jgi:hypothetical protein